MMGKKSLPVYTTYSNFMTIYTAYIYFYHYTDFTESIIEKTKGVFGSIDLEHLDI